MEKFVRNILETYYPEEFEEIYEKSLLIQYLDKKSGAIHGAAKTRRSLANYYAIYSILNFYVDDFQNDPEAYKKFEGYEYTKLFEFYRGLYGGCKLQRHALNGRLNREFRNKVHADKDLVIVNDGKYALHIDYLYVEEIDISSPAKEIVERYVQLLMEKDYALLAVLTKMGKTTTVREKKLQISNLLTEDTETHIFEILTFAILKSYYRTQRVLVGTTKEDLHEEPLELYKMGRAVEEGGGIAFVMRPIGRFFQVTERNHYDRYLIGIDKALHFPVTFVIKTEKEKAVVEEEIEEYIWSKSGGMLVVQERYRKAFEEIITINEIKEWLFSLEEESVDSIIQDIDFCYKMEMNLEDFGAE